MISPHATLAATPTMRAALLFVVLTLPVPGLVAQVEFETTVCFGDSLTHNNLLGLVSGIPQNVYGVDPMEAAFLKGHHPGDELTSYAVGGSESDELVLQAAAYAFNVFVGNQNLNN